MNSNGVRSSRSPLIRFLSFVRPHLALVVGAALTGVGKFTLPLAFPLAFKYVIDVLLSPQPKLDGIDRAIDRWCAAVAHVFNLSATAQGKLAALSIAMLLLYAIQCGTSYFRDYWAGI